MRVRPKRAHPRSRGEHVSLDFADSSDIGSSPLTRGAHLLERGDGCASGLIPAHAGSTHEAEATTGAPTAHPRSRGEHLMVRLCSFSRKGSSPLTRGARSPPASSSGSRAHPRSRGEHSSPIAIRKGQRGSSPLTRGALGAAGGIVGGAGLIPAHAGSTTLFTPRAVRGRAHPRSRGEHSGVSDTRRLPLGSSPLTRGARPAVW